jgi:monovalent cation:H+ antiporter-2, CPA2 family
MTDSSHIQPVLILLLAAIASVPLFHRLGMSSVLGYLVAGVLIGPFGFRLIPDIEQAQIVAEVGVIFLLFAIGLDLPFKRLRAVWRYLFGLGLAQVGLSSLVIGLGAWTLGQSGEAAIVIGGALALSSTAIVLQLLAERGELAARFGRIAVAVLLFQDLAVIPLLTLLPLVACEQTSLATALGLAFIKAVIALALVVTVGQLIVRPAYRFIASLRLPELFAATTLFIVLGTGWLTAQFGMSMALGAFLAGLLLAETEFRHQIEADIKPFRGLFLGLFFLTVGMHIDLQLIYGKLAIIVAFALGLISVKALVLAGLCRVFALDRSTSARLGLLLAQGGEFAFVILGLATQLKVLVTETGSLLIAIVSLTMAATPLLAVVGRRLATALEQRDVAEIDQIAEEVRGLSNHIIVAGFGRVGQIVGSLLGSKGIPYIAIDFSMQRVAEGRKRGLPLYYGDASRPEVLQAAGIENAAGAVITIDQPDDAERIVAALIRSQPDLKIVVRSRDAEHGTRLVRAGAAAVIHEAFEPGLQMGATALQIVGATQDEVARALDAARQHAAPSPRL